MNETNGLGATADKSPVIKALRLLAYVARCREPVALAELSRAIGLPKPTVFRLMRNLETVGFLRRDPLTRRHQIGSLFEDIALSALRHGTGQGTRRLLMDQLAHRLGARINLVVLRSGNVLFVEWVESTTPLRVDIDPTTSMPVHCTASGKLLLAFGPAELRESFLRSAPFPARTKNTMTSARALKQALSEIRQRGYSEDNEELLPGVNCLAVPIYSRAGDVAAGLAAMAPVASLPLHKLRRQLPALLECAARISRELGGTAPFEAAGRDSFGLPAADGSRNGASPKKPRSRNRGGGIMRSHAAQRPRGTRKRARIGAADER